MVDIYVFGKMRVPGLATMTMTGLSDFVCDSIEEFFDDEDELISS